MTEYLVPYESAESEFEEKRSRFISHVFLVESEAEARARIDEMKKKYYDARHNCWCFVLHDGTVRYGDEAMTVTAVVDAKTRGMYRKYDPSWVEADE